MNAQTYLTLTHLRGVGRTTARRVAALCAGDTSDSDTLLEALCRVGGRRLSGLSRQDLDRAADRADRDLASATGRGLTVLVLGDSRYPARLSRVPDPPLVLFVLGEVAALGAEQSVAIVGTRNPSTFGRRAAGLLTRSLSRARWSIISGLALGIDGIAHEECLREGGTTVAVLAGGLDTVSPRQHADMAERIVNAGGCLASEYAIGVPALPRQFVERDRIQAGLADFVLVVETDVDGGSMHTARFAKEARRPVAAALPPSHWPNECIMGGNRLLIARGAKPISDRESLAQFLNCRAGNHQAEQVELFT